METKPEINPLEEPIIKPLEEPVITPLTGTNPLICDPETGVCEVPGLQPEKELEPDILPINKQVKVIYFTDPICSSCWAIEPQLRKMKLEYGHEIDVDYRMGGLLPDWSYSSGGINSPVDVAHHWDEVSAHYDMPIDGDVWLDDPLDSSYPPSIAFKAAQMQDPEKAIVFMRKLREKLFLEKQNITRLEVMAEAANYARLDEVQFKEDYQKNAEAEFKDDLQLAKQMGVRGFPTLFFTDGNGKTEVVYGSRPYAHYESAIVRLNAEAERREYEKTWQNVFSQYPTLTSREFAELTETARQKADAVLAEIAQTGAIEKQESKNGPIWKLRETVNPEAN